MYHFIFIVFVLICMSCVKSKNYVAKQHINDITPNITNGLGSSNSAANGASIHNPLAIILQNANNDDFIFAGNNSFELINVKL